MKTMKYIYALFLGLLMTRTRFLHGRDGSRMEESRKLMDYDLSLSVSASDVISPLTKALGY